jgi:small subunit ribosomal protein S11
METSKTATKSGKTRSKVKKKSRVKVSRGRLCINATYNNTIISATDQNGNVIAWATAGNSGFKGSKKSTPFAGQKTMETLLTKIKDSGMSEVEVFMTGLGAGRESAVRALHGTGFSILSIKDRTPVKHGGVREAKHA